MTTTPTPKPEVTNWAVSSTSRDSQSSNEKTEPGMTPSSPFSVILELEVPIPFRALADLVRSLDAEQIQAVAMAQLEWGDDQNLTHYILETIALALEAFEDAD